MICTDLMVEWLVEVRKKVSSVQYMVALATFGLIMAAGVEWGILAGLALHHGVMKWTGEAGTEEVRSGGGAKDEGGVKDELFTHNMHSSLSLCSYTFGSASPLFLT